MLYNEEEHWCVITISTGYKDITPENVAEVIATGRKARKAEDLTGLSVFAYSNNLNLIEGNKEKLHQLHAEHRKHPLHHTVIKIYDGPVPYRFFEDFPLAFRVLGPENFKHLDSFQSAEDREFLKEFIEGDHLVCKLVANFIRSNQ